MCNINTIYYTAFATLKCMVYIVWCTWCTPYTVRRISYVIKYIPFTVRRTILLYGIHCTFSLYITHYKTYRIFPCVVYIFNGVNCTVRYIRCNISKSPLSCEYRYDCRYSRYLLSQIRLTWDLHREHRWDSASDLTIPHNYSGGSCEWWYFTPGGRQNISIMDIDNIIEHSLWSISK